MEGHDAPEPAACWPPPLRTAGFGDSKTRPSQREKKQTFPSPCHIKSSFLELECAYESREDLLKMQILIQSAGVGPGTLHF